MKSHKPNAAISLLRCPYCHTPFTQIHSFALQCSCDTYPIIDQIIYLKKHPNLLHQRAVTLLKQGKKRSAILLLLDSRRIANYLITFIPFLSHTILMSMLKSLYPSARGWWQYLLHRNQGVTHILALSTIGAIQKGNVVVDICCGQGEFVQKMAAWSHARSIIGIDKSFFLLLVARKYFVPSNTLLICSDVHGGLPFRPRSIHRAFFNDCFMYINNKTVTHELQRILTSLGETYLNHVHNLGYANLGQGKGVSPKSLKKIVAGRFELGHQTDISFYSKIKHHKSIMYDTSAHTKPYRSYSYRLTPCNHSACPLIPPRQLYSYVDRITLDFSEDLDLKNLTSTK